MDVQHDSSGQMHGETITVVAPSGATLTEKYLPHDKVATLLHLAVKDFEKEGQLDSSQEYVLVLGATPLDEHLSLEDAGVKAGDALKIRSKGIPGDGHAS